VGNITDGRPSAAAVAAAAVATAGTTLVLDLAWLGVLARDFYREALGGLMREEAFVPAAALFYAFYVAVTTGWAVLGAGSPGEAARRGAGLGFVAYTTYELTNWAVIRDWPAVIVPVDLAWGVVLTTVAALAGKAAESAARRRAA
jgi:uncharacterized membrane protein